MSRWLSLLVLLAVTSCRTVAPGALRLEAYSHNTGIELVFLNDTGVPIMISESSVRVELFRDDVRLWSWFPGSNFDSSIDPIWLIQPLERQGTMRFFNTESVMIPALAETSVSDNLRLEVVFEVLDERHFSFEFLKKADTAEWIESRRHVEKRERRPSPKTEPDADGW